MVSLRTQNALLFVIALCLVLLVVHFYSGHLVAKAYAAISPAPKDSAGAVVLYGCYQTDPKKPCDWQPVQVDKFGHLITK